MTLSHSGYGQSFGGTPNRFSFQQIDNDTVQVVFPEGLDYWGQRVANLSMYQASFNDSSLLTPPIKTTIIIRNLTTNSNGFVAYAPYRSEYFTTPPFSQRSGVSPWIDLLHIHEYRHILQESKVMVGRKWAPEHILFGQGGWSVVNFALLPNWYYEGDAVKTETLYTHSGRGRTPLFYLQIPALRKSGKHYSFEKIRAGSFKDPVPNHYVLGYHMTSYMQLTKGVQSWDKITNRSIKKYTLISQSSKKLYGLNNVKLYSETVKHLDSYFEDLPENTDSIVLALDSSNFTSYQLPKTFRENSLLYIKSSFKKIPAYYLFDGVKETKLFEPNLFNSENWYDVHDNLLIWAETVPNAFWQNEDYSALKILDIESGKVQYLGPKKRKYFYPLWSENGENIGVLELGSSTRQYLVLLDKNAKELKRLELEEGLFISSIIHIEGSVFWVVKNENEQAKITSFDLESGKSESLNPAINALIRHPIIHDKYIYFSTTVGIQEQIVRMSLETQEMEVMTDASFRAIDPMIKDDQLYYVSYEGIGYTIRKKSLTPLHSFYSQLPEIAFYNELDQGFGSILQNVPTKKYETKKFKKSTGLFQIHSWIPQVLPPNFGLTLLLQNKIGTFQSELTYVYNSNEGASQFSARVNYAQIYPKFFVAAAHTLNRDANSLQAPLDQIPSEFYGRQWAETDFSGGITLPFYLTRGKWNRFLSFEGSANYLIAYYNEIVPSLSNLEFPFENSRISFYNIKNRARRQIYSRWGQSIVLDQSYSLDPSVNATQFYLISTFYFPGLFNTHSFTISPSYKYEPIDNQYNYLDAFAPSYGYVKYAALDSYRVLFKYTMPLWYPDIGIPGTAFFQRLYGSVFYDESIFTDPSYESPIYQRSFGLEINVNMVLLRILPFEIGVRGMYRLDPYTEGSSPYYVELLFYGFNF
jgi:hypothetical protein